MGAIHTVLGDIVPDQLGYCQTHEHVICDQRLAPHSAMISRSRRVEDSYMILDSVEDAVDELSAYYDAGGRALVEVTTYGWGRDPEALAEISRRTGVHIVMTTGFYTEPHMPLRATEWSITELANWITEEITEGAMGTGIKAGMIKSGVYAGRIEGLELKGLHAVARAQRATGAPITTHTSGARRYEVPGGNLGKHHLRILLEEGADPRKFIAGHTDERPDIGFLSEIASMGSYVQFDVIGKLHWLRDETRVDLMKELFRRGHGDRILVGTDRCRKAELHKHLGGLGYTHIFDSFLDTMRAGGMSEEQITAITVENPARVLTIG